MGQRHTDARDLDVHGLELVPGFLDQHLDQDRLFAEPGTAAVDDNAAAGGRTLLVDQENLAGVILEQPGIAVGDDGLVKF